MRNEQIVALTSAPNPKLSKGQLRLLEVLQCEENRSKPVAEICKLAGYTSTTPWNHALRNEQFVAAAEALGIFTRRHSRDTHLEVDLATNIEEELAKDIWDMRRLKPDYPKHVPPAAYEVDFTWISQLVSP